MSSPLRILHVVTHMNRGGLETMLMNYYRKIDRSKVQFDFLTHRSDPKDYDEEIISMGGKIFHLPVLNPISIKYRKSLDKFFDDHKEYDIVHSHLDCMSYYPLSSAKKAGVKTLIAHSHNADQEKNLKYIIKQNSKNKIPSVATHYFACGIKAGEFLFNGAEYKVINNAIDASKFRFKDEMRYEVRKKLSITNETVIGHVGRFNIQKNHKFLIKVFCEFLKAEPNSILLLIGVGELKADIEKQVKQLGIISNVRFLGLRDDIPSLMQGMDVFLFPSLFEGFPLTLVEAQASGLPCIVSDCISKEVILRTSVTQVSLNASIGNWIELLREVSIDQARKNGFDEICESGFDIENNSKQLEAFYLDLVNNIHL